MKKLETKNQKNTVNASHPKEETPMKKTASHTTKPAHSHAKETTAMSPSTKDTAENATHTKEVTTMKTHATTTASTTGAPVTSTTGDVPSQLQALEERCGYGDPLPDDVRKVNDNLVRRIPTSVVDRIVALAGRGNGKVAGIAFDPVAAKAALAAADDAEAVATAAFMLARRAQDQSIRLRSGVIGEVSGIKTALRGYVKTKQGASLAQASEEIQSLVKQHKAATKAFRTRIEKEIADQGPGKEGTTTDAVATPVVTPPVVAEAPAAPKGS